MGMSKGSMPMPAPTSGGMSKGSAPGGAFGASSGPPQFYTKSATQGLIGGLGASPGQQQLPGFTFGGGYYGGDALGTAGQLLAGGPPSLDPSQAGNPQAIGNFGPNAVTSVQGSGGGGGVPGAGGLPPGYSPIMQTGAPAITPGMQMPPAPMNATRGVNPATPVTAAPPGATPGAPVPGGTPTAGVKPTTGTKDLVAGPTGATPLTFGGTGTTPFQTAMDPNRMGGSPFGQLVRANLARYGNSPTALAARNAPGSFTVNDFNRVQGQDPGIANAMLAQGGQGYRNAVMGANGWDNQQMNQFINNAAYSPGGQQSYPGFTPDVLARLKAMGIG